MTSPWPSEPSLIELVDRRGWWLAGHASGWVILYRWGRGWHPEGILLSGPRGEVIAALARSFEGSWDELVDLAARLAGGEVPDETVDGDDLPRPPTGPGSRRRLRRGWWLDRRGETRELVTVTAARLQVTALHLPAPVAIAAEALEPHWAAGWEALLAFVGGAC